MAPPDRELGAFREGLLAEIRENRGGSAELPEFSENVFTAICLEWLEDVGLTENSEVCHFERSFGNRNARANGYAVDDDEAVVDVFIACFDGGDVSGMLPPDDLRRAARQAKTFCEKVSTELLSNLDPSGRDYGMVERFGDVAPKASKFRVFVITDQACSLSSIDAEDLNGKDLVYEIIDIERLYRLVQAGLPRDEVVIDFTQHAAGGLPCLHAPEISGDYDAYLALIPGEMLYQLYDLYGPRLLERNVRSFLQARGKINRGIRDTLRKQPDRFLAYNNGIVATVDEIHVRHDQAAGSRHITSVRGLQIVNGGQTTASIHRARRDDKVDLSSVYVPAKISLISEGRIEEMVPAISLYANSQNNIQMADFSANDPYHVRMGQLSGQIWCPGEQGRWFYERTRGEYEVEKIRTAKTPAQLRRFNERTPRQRKFDKVELAKFLLSWEQRPDKVSLGGQKCFASFMQDLSETHSKDWLPDDGDYRRAIAKGILYRSALAITRQEDFPAYRAQVATYLVAYLSHRTGRQINLERIWNEQGLSSELVALLRSWAYGVRDAIVQSSGGRNVTEWCKKDACWKALRAVDLSLSDELPPEIDGASSSSAATSDVSNLTPAELDAIHHCQKITAEEWIRISKWGSETGRLKDWQTGIAGTLGTYAARDWSKSPSSKQAKRGLEILLIAREDGGPLASDPDA
ncbi:AIPR family protein [Sphingomonas sp. OK281]|uniref:AIPR family protein n=1 Tax=Sphingomonas sp. OK281 TaxID=1881067 RepID=UPI0008E12804|nr:AIPR family protein [Sphingomonas sp. OK281]SFO30253.1 AIPR protein [Sphingomonas sp. OK281]